MQQRTERRANTSSIRSSGSGDGSSSGNLMGTRHGKKRQASPQRTACTPQHQQPEKRLGDTVTVVILIFW